MYIGLSYRRMIWNLLHFSQCLWRSILSLDLSARDHSISVNVFGEVISSISELEECRLLYI